MVLVYIWFIFGFISNLVFVEYNKSSPLPGTCADRRFASSFCCRDVVELSVGLMPDSWSIFVDL